MKFTLAVLAGLFASTTAAPIADCDVQAGCIAFSVTEVADGSTCGGTDCKYQVCVRTDLELTCRTHRPS